MPIYAFLFCACALSSFYAFLSLSVFVLSSFCVFLLFSEPLPSASAPTGLQNLHTSDLHQPVCKFVALLQVPSGVGQEVSFLDFRLQ